VLIALADDWTADKASDRDRVPWGVFRAVAEDVIHYHDERNHQAIGSRLISSPPT